MHHIRSVTGCTTNPVYSNSITTGERAESARARKKLYSSQKLHKFYDFTWFLLI